MKILIVNIFAQYGSTGRLVWSIHQYLLKNGCHSLICYGRGERLDDPYLKKISYNIAAKFYALLTRFYGEPYNCSFLETYKLKKIIEKESPDIVHLHCLNCFYVNMYQLIDFLKKKKIRTVLTLHAETMYTGGCAHAYDCNKWKTGCGKCPNLWEATKSYFWDRTSSNWTKLYKVYEGFENLTVVGVSSWLSKRAQQSPMFKKNIVTINNGVDSDIFHYTPICTTKEAFKILHFKDNNKMVLHVNPTFTDPLKGGHFVIEFANKLIHEKVVIVILGYKGDTKTLPKNVLAFDLIKDTKVLAEIYSCADLTLLTSKRETFSLVCAESLCCGTPLIGFKAGAPEEIALKEYSEFVEYGDINNLYKAYLNWIDFKANNNALEISRVAINEYSSIKMCEKYQTLYKQLVLK